MEQNPPETPTARVQAFPVRPSKESLTTPAKRKHFEYDGVLPENIWHLLQENRKLSCLHEWQVQCLLFEQECTPENRNLVYISPTGGGKTLVAEVLLLRTIVNDAKHALFILPYVALVEEKVRQMSVWENLFDVDAYCGHKGHIPPRLRRRKKCIFIATIEKANGLVNWLIEQKKLQEFGLVVVDELQFVGDDSSRGVVLESLLAKILFTAHQHVQLVGMSATLSCKTELCRFLRARLFEATIRTNPLTEYLKCANDIFRLDGSYQRTSKPKNERDIDGIVSLATEKGVSCLIFCASKTSTEAIALRIAREAPSETAPDTINHIGEQQHMSPQLRQLLLCGVGYHHSGLMVEEKQLVEDLFRNGHVKILVATSTLAAGVNLPAERVIVRSPYVGMAFITKSRYTQMVGRAGRAGFAASGESYLIFEKKDLDRVHALINAEYDSLKSCLLTDEMRGLQRLLLDGLCLGIATCRAHIYALVKCTLLAQWQDIQDVCDEALRYLVGAGVISDTREDSTTTSEYRVTGFGRAVHKSCMDPATARLVYSEFLRSQVNLVLGTELHLLYLITPVDAFQAIRIDPEVYRKCQSAVTTNEYDLRATELLGITERYLMLHSRNRKVTIQRDTVTATHSIAAPMPDDMIYRRFWITLILYDLIHEHPPWAVAEKFNVSPGDVQRLQSSAAMFGSMMTVFAAELEDVAWGIKVIVKQLVSRLWHGVREELTPLMEVSGVKQGRARQLYQAGYTTVAELAAAYPRTLCSDIENLFLNQATNIVREAKRIIKKQARELLEQADDIEP